MSLQILKGPWRKIFRRIFFNYFFCIELVCWKCSDMLDKSDINVNWKATRQTYIFSLEKALVSLLTFRTDFSMLTKLSIAAKWLTTLSSLFSPNLIDQSSCKMGLVLACVVRILHGDWPIK